MSNGASKNELTKAMAAYREFRELSVQLHLPGYDTAVTHGRGPADDTQ
jgi:hypothetical protein